MLQSMESQSAGHNSEWTKGNARACLGFIPTLIFFLSLSFFFNLISFFNFTILYWFCHISKWIRHRYTCVPHKAQVCVHSKGSLGCPDHIRSDQSLSRVRLFATHSYHIFYFYICHQSQNTLSLFLL